MKKNKSTIIWVTVIVLVLGGLFSWSKIASRGPGELDAFAQCLDEKGAVFYGAFWCPHCQNQKAFFGKSQKLLPYVECSTPNGREQNNLCKEKNIESYPTWEFADGSREFGELPLDRLAEKTGCELPNE